MSAFPMLGPYEVLACDALYLLTILEARMTDRNVRPAEEPQDKRTVNPDGSISVEIHTMQGLRGFLRGKR